MNVKWLSVFGGGGGGAVTSACASLSLCVRAYVIWTFSKVDGIPSIEKSFKSKIQIKLFVRMKYRAKINCAEF